MNCTGKFSKNGPHGAQAEEPLVTLARRGSSEAFSELVRMHSRRIYVTSLRILKNNADAEDNLQDVLYKVYKNMRQFRGQSQFSTWLVRITINEALVKIRKERFAHAAGLASLPAGDDENNFVLEIRDQGPDAERQHIAGELAEKAFHGLDPLLKRIFILHAGDGWTHRELANAMGVAVGTVKSRIFRARARMQHHLQTL